jgi:hypothetical protein
MDSEAPPNGLNFHERGAAEPEANETSPAQTCPPGRRARGGTCDGPTPFGVPDEGCTWRLARLLRAAAQWSSGSSESAGPASTSSESTPSRPSPTCARAASRLGCSARRSKPLHLAALALALLPLPGVRHRPGAGGGVHSESRVDAGLSRPASPVGLHDSIHCRVGVGARAGRGGEGSGCSLNRDMPVSAVASRSLLRRSTRAPAFKALPALPLRCAPAAPSPSSRPSLPPLA